jgi:hypothetical protein
MRLKVLMENSTMIDEYYLAEPGLSLLLEDGDTRLIFDTGYSGASCPMPKPCTRTSRPLPPSSCPMDTTTTAQACATGWPDTVQARIPSQPL